MCPALEHNPERGTTIKELITNLIYKAPRRRSRRHEWKEFMEGQGRKSLGQNHQLKAHVAELEAARADPGSIEDQRLNYVTSIEALPPAQRKQELEAFKTALNLNSLGLPRSEKFDPKHKVKTALTPISRLRKKMSPSTLWPWRSPSPPKPKRQRRTRASGAVPSGRRRLSRRTPPKPLRRP